MLIQRLLLVIALVLPAAALADNPDKVSFSPTTGSLYLTPFVDILPDPSQSLTVHEVARSKLTAAFVPAAQIGNSFGFTDTAYWIRFSLDIEETPGHSILLQLDSPLIDDVQFYIPDGSNGYIMKQAGEGLHFDQRQITHRTYLFHLPHHGGEARTYYMRLQTEGSMHIPLYLWTHEAFIEHVGVSTLVLGGYLGFMLLLVLVTLAAYQKIHERIFLAYSAYLGSFLLLQLSLLGYGFQYFWPAHPEWSNRATSVSVGLAVISGLKFSGMFLQVFGNEHSRIKAVFQAMMLCGAVSVAMSLFGNFSLAAKVSTILGIMLPPVVLLGAISALRDGYRPARYFLVAWCIFLSGVLIAGLLFLGLLPHTPLTFYAMQIGAAFEVVLIGYALMDRIELLRIEKEQAKLHANQCLLKLNGELESLVKERTDSLQKMNNELRELATHDSMTGLLNHSASLNALKSMQTSALRYGRGFAVVMIDIDHFKSVNDQYGHPAGDLVIKSIATTLQASLRQSDVCGRYGGEEFILILPQSDARHASQLAERIRLAIQRLNIEEVHYSEITASFGIALFDPANPEENLIAWADQALYEAKENGRNRVVVAESTLAISDNQ